MQAKDAVLSTILAISSRILAMTHKHILDPATTDSDYWELRQRRMLESIRKQLWAWVIGFTVVLSFVTAVGINDLLNRKVEAALGDVEDRANQRVQLLEQKIHDLSARSAVINALEISYLKHANSLWRFTQEIRNDIPLAALEQMHKSTKLRVFESMLDRTVEFPIDRETLDLIIEAIKPFENDQTKLEALRNKISKHSEHVIKTNALRQAIDDAKTNYAKAANTQTYVARSIYENEVYPNYNAYVKKYYETNKFGAEPKSFDFIANTTDSELKFYFGDRLSIPPQ
jgi:hypothetical protein